jgi:hypothetical protein
VLDEREDVYALAAQRGGFEEVGGEDGLSLERRNAAQLVEVRSGAGLMPASLRISHSLADRQSRGKTGAPYDTNVSSYELRWDLSKWRPRGSRSNSA